MQNAGFLMTRLISLSRSSAGLSRSGFPVWYDIIRADTLQHVHNDQMCSVEIECDFGLTNLTIMVEGDHDLSHDLTRRV